MIINPSGKYSFLLIKFKNYIHHKVFNVFKITSKTSSIREFSNDDCEHVITENRVWDCEYPISVNLKCDIHTFTFRAKRGFSINIVFNVFTITQNTIRTYNAGGNIEFKREAYVKTFYGLNGEEVQTFLMHTWAKNL